MTSLSLCPIVTAALVIFVCAVMAAAHALVKLKQRVASRMGLFKAEHKMVNDMLDQYKDIDAESRASAAEIFFHHVNTRDFIYVLRLTDDEFEEYQSNVLGRLEEFKEYNGLSIRELRKKVVDWPRWRNRSKTAHAIKEAETNNAVAAAAAE